MQMNIMALCIETLGKHPLELDWLPYDEIPKLAAYLQAKNEAESGEKR